jgi:hypothetical protein
MKNEGASKKWTKMSHWGCSGEAALGNQFCFTCSGDWGIAGILG